MVLARRENPIGLPVRKPPFKGVEWLAKTGTISLTRWAAKNACVGLHSMQFFQDKCRVKSLKSCAGGGQCSGAALTSMRQSLAAARGARGSTLDAGKIESTKSD